MPFDSDPRARFSDTPRRRPSAVAASIAGVQAIAAKGSATRTALERVAASAAPVGRLHRLVSLAARGSLLMLATALLLSAIGLVRIGSLP